MRLQSQSNAVTPLRILLAGPTCCGKSSIARAVRRSLPQGACAIVSLDAYYRDLSHLPIAERARANFDHPDAIDWPLLQTHMASLSAGKSLWAPVYDFANHARRPEIVEIPGAPIAIVEGILALYDDALNAIADLRVYVDAPDDLCLLRRIERDCAERGRTEQSVRAQFRATVLPMAERFVRPTKGRAELVFDGALPTAALAKGLLERIPEPYRR